MISTLLARHYRTGRTVEVTVDGERIGRIREVDSDEREMQWIAPGLVDLQINGFAGVDFNRPLTDRETWNRACRSLLGHGCTHFLATLITNSCETLETLLGGLRDAIGDEPSNCIGVHLEGPFLNPDPGYRGAHDPDWMIPPDIGLFRRWQDASGHSIRMITLAPEPDPDLARSFIRTLASEGTRVALGHSGAMGSVLDQAIEAGASLWTHLGNAAASPCPKFENVVFHALARPGLMASIIADGHHIPAHALSVICRSLGERLILVTDAMTGAGSPPGRYSMCHLDIEIGRDGIARMPDSGRLAGSTLTPFETVFRAAELTGLPWQEMWTAMSTRPAHWLGLSHDLAAGQAACFCLFETRPQPSLRETWLNGKAHAIGTD